MEGAGGGARQEHLADMNGILRTDAPVRRPNHLSGLRGIAPECRFFCQTGKMNGRDFVSVAMFPVKPFSLRPGNGFARLVSLTFLLCPMSAWCQDVAGQEILYPGDAFAKLDTFEGLNLEDADKLYGKGDFKGAYAAYKAYSFEFPKSKAMPYVLLRMGRCLHKLDKRNAAVTAYQDVVDYFPDDVRYAAAALYHIGECHGQNGDEAKRTAVWARMVKDDGYVTQPNSAACRLQGSAHRSAGRRRKPRLLQKPDGSLQDHTHGQPQ